LYFEKNYLLHDSYSSMTMFRFDKISYLYTIWRDELVCGFGYISCLCWCDQWSRYRQNLWRISLVAMFL